MLRLSVLFVLALMPLSLGAQEHWAYRKPIRPALPAGSQHPIDAFVTHQLTKRGLKAAPPTDRATLLRRVSLDLVGLPPSLEELEAFLRDERPDAYERVVDRLLASPRFGEHHARSWLDLARYADSNGFQADQLRESWAFRDWVIDALNADMPFDQFTIEQIAGDTLPKASRAQRIATGFHRTVTCNVEAGVHPEANRVNQVFDRVNTSATVWLGTTMSCAQCHDHKYDPFSQKEYYEIFSFFNNTPLEVENPNGKAGVQFDFIGPSMKLALRPEQSAARAKLRQEIARLEGEVARTDDEGRERREAWIARARRASKARHAWRTIEAASFASNGDEEWTRLDDGSILIGGRVPGTARYTVRSAFPPGTNAIRLDVLTHDSLPGRGPGRGDAKRPNFILSEFRVELRDRGARRGKALRLRDARADYEQKRYPVRAAIDGKPRTGWAIGGGFGRDHYAIFRLGEALSERDARSKELVFTLDQNFGRGRTIGRFRLSAFTEDPILLDFDAKLRAAVEAESPTPVQRQLLRRAYRSRDARAAKITRRLEATRKRLKAIRPHTTLVMVEQDKARETHVLLRGDYRDRGARVQAGTPKVLHAWKEGMPRTRLGFARWLVDPENPLVARVTVNRWWARIFGRGIVVTEEDFGTRSAKPTHPGLLDWLAVEFMESGWSRKHMLRLIVTSDAYRRSSQRARARDADPQNLYLARGPRFRMSAEMIRDNALAVSGLLEQALGGPPVYPPQPPGLWRQTGRNEPKYRVAIGRERFRRGIYVIWRRAAPYPSFVLFDGPDRCACQPARSRTNTPMQALTLMNDEAYVEMALALAQRVLREAGASNAARIRHAFRRVLSRPPRPDEAAHLAAVFAHELRRYRAQPEAAEALLKGLDGIEVDAELDRCELAACFHVATILLNLDETISKG